jgi:hypothetical protein
MPAPFRKRRNSGSLYYYGAQDGQMSWTWHWRLFIVALIICSVIVRFTSAAMNGANLKRREPHADTGASPALAVMGHIVSGAIFAAVISGIAGFFF